MNHIEDAEIYTRVQGNVKPSGFAEYDHLTGYLVRTYTVEWEDSSGIRWRKTCEVVNLGRPDRGIPIDPDVLLADEPHLAIERTGAEAAIAANKEQGAARYAQMQAEIVAYLNRFGPSRTVNIQDDLSYKKSTLLEHLRKGEGTIYARIKTVGRSVVWGLMGVDEQQEAA